MGKMRTKITSNGYNFFEHCLRENPMTEMDSPRKIDNDTYSNKSIFDNYFGKKMQAGSQNCPTTREM